MVRRELKLTVITLLLFMWIFLFMGAYQIKEDLPIKIPDISISKINLSQISVPKVDISKLEIPQSIEIELLMNKYKEEKEKAIIDFQSSKEFDSDIYSKYAILVELNSGKVIDQKASGERIYPASLTKIMTAILAIEQISDLQKEVVLPEGMFEKLNYSGASVAGFLPNEKVKAIDLLYGAVMPSGADATEGLAIYISGSEEEFANLMNKKAKELNMDNTHFVNSSGLHDEQQYTTAQDLAKLFNYALKNKTFREVITTRTYTSSPTPFYQQGRYFSNFIFKYLYSTNTDYGIILGGKTGYTKEAGLCLATLAQKGDKQYILITAGANGNLRNEQYNIIDAVNIYNNYLQ